MNDTIRLLTAMGTNTALAWELVDFLNGGPEIPFSAEARRVRERLGGKRCGQVCLLCTGGVMAEARKLKGEMEAAYPLKVELIPLACDDIGCSDDDHAMRKAVYEVVTRLAGPDLVISSAGRKTITQRLMEAAIMHGCAGYLTITAPAGVERKIKKRQDALAYAADLNIIWTPAGEFYQDKRKRIIREEIGDTFRSIYLLPNSLIDRLRREKIGAAPKRADAELAWLVRLPKTDLHCHLGGAYDMELLRELAATLLDDLEVSGDERKIIRERLATRIGGPLDRITPEHLRALAPDAVHCLANLETLYHGEPRPHVAHAALLTALDHEQMARLAADGKDTPPLNLDWYMKSGDLGGSKLLQSENTLRRAAAWLVQAAAADGVRYLEIRFSPGNYTRTGLDIDQVVEIIREEAANRAEEEGITVNLLVMATRHKDEAEMRANVEAAVRAVDHPGPCRVTGFDLAGQEENNPPEKFTGIFEPLHKKFINVTIHAGEMDTEEKIWQAMYRLHAKRIGHGLKMEENKKMMDYVRDWTIAVEMCPSSNRQTNGYRFFDRSEDGGKYPLKKYLDHGLQVTVNTDNLGISKTTASRELLTAARMTAGGLSLWDILRIVRNGFKAAFLPKDEKDRLLKEVDQRIFELLLEEL